LGYVRQLRKRGWFEDDDFSIPGAPGKEKLHEAPLYNWANKWGQVISSFGEAGLRWFESVKW